MEIQKVKIQRYVDNPIVVPGKYPWRSAVTFNPGVIYDNGKFYLFERAAGTIRPFKCQIGLLESGDGFDFTHVTDKPVFIPEMLNCPDGTIEDPRIVKIEDKYYMAFAQRIYTYDCHPTGLGVPDYQPIKSGLDEVINNTRSGIAVSRDMLNWEFVGYTTPPEIDDRDNVLFPEKINGRFALLRRPMTYVGRDYGCSGPSIWICYSDNLKKWTEPLLVAKPENEWEGGRIGAASPPLRTKAGWLTLYHGVDKNSVYRVGVMLLDIDDPEKVMARSPEFIMEP